MTPFGSDRLGRFPFNTNTTPRPREVSGWRLEMIQQLLVAAERDSDVALLGAGPLEEVVRMHGDDLVYELERLARQDSLSQRARIDLATAGLLVAMRLSASKGGHHLRRMRDLRAPAVIRGAAAAETCSETSVQSTPGSGRISNVSGGKSLSKATWVISTIRYVAPCKRASVRSTTPRSWSMLRSRSSGSPTTRP